jgi:hypothetical protein
MMHYIPRKLSLTTTDIQDPTSKEKEESEELEKCKANEERFLKFASKRHPDHPAYADYIERQKAKKQKPNERHIEKQGFNSPNRRTKKTSRIKKHSPPYSPTARSTRMHTKHNARQAHVRKITPDNTEPHLTRQHERYA